MCWNCFLMNSLSICSELLCPIFGRTAGFQAQFGFWTLYSRGMVVCILWHTVHTSGKGDLLYIYLKIPTCMYHCSCGCRQVGCSCSCTAHKRLLLPDLSFSRSASSVRTQTQGANVPSLVVKLTNSLFTFLKINRDLTPCTPSSILPISIVTSYGFSFSFSREMKRERERAELWRGLEEHQERRMQMLTEAARNQRNLQERGERGDPPTPSSPQTAHSDQPEPKPSGASSSSSSGAGESAT